MATPQIPGLAEPISDDWVPDRKLLRDNPAVRFLSEDELAQAIIDFRTHCKNNNIEKVRWGHTFVTWLRKGRPA